MTLRGIILKLHLWLGLTAGFFLVVLGLTGSVIAFEGDIPHWLHPNLFYVRPEPHVLSEQELIRIVERRFAARALDVQVLRHSNLAHVVSLPGHVSVFVNQYNGTILGSVTGGFASDRVLGYVHQIHLRLVPDPRSLPGLAAVGTVIVSCAGVLLCLLVPTGLTLFWRTRRATVKWRASRFKVCFDLHHVVGAYAGLFLLLSALTGVLIGFPWGEKLIFAAAGSGMPPELPAPHSVPAPGAAQLTIDSAIAIAHAAMPDGTLTGYSLPKEPDDVFEVSLRVPQETSQMANSSVTVDQYSGRILQTRNFRTDSAGFYWVRFNRSLHTGDIFGTPTHVLAAVSSLLLVVMVMTGWAIWWRKLAV